MPNEKLKETCADAGSADTTSNPARADSLKRCLMRNILRADLSDAAIPAQVASVVTNVAPVVSHVPAIVPDVPRVLSRVGLVAGSTVFPQIRSVASQIPAIRAHVAAILPELATVLMSVPLRGECGTGGSENGDEREHRETFHTASSFPLCVWTGSAAPKLRRHETVTPAAGSA